MTRIATHVAVAGINLDRHASVPLSIQLYEALRQAILRGQLRPGTRLPSTRSLAEEYEVSRNTAVFAFEQLLAEGYLEAKVGSGTSVARSLPAELLTMGKAAIDLGCRPSSRRTLSRWAKVIGTYSCYSIQHRRPIRLLAVPDQPRPFESGLPDTSVFPFKIWARLLTRYWRHANCELLTYENPAGYWPLREAIAEYLRTARAVQCEVDQVIVVNGSQQGLDLAAHLLIDSGDKVLLEDPGYPGARVALQGAGARLIRVPIDGEGANIHGIKQKISNVRFIFITPSYQFPLGVTMNVARRLALLDQANRWGAWVLEDDCDSEYRYRGRPLPSLQGLDSTGRVIYMGTFNKTLFPSLRLGFLVLPKDLIEAFCHALSVTDGYSPLAEQAVLADFIAEGHFARHIRRMRALYQERQSVLIEAIRQELSGLLEAQSSDGGMHVVGWLPKGVHDVVASQRAAACGVFARPLSSCSIGKLTREGLLLGYAALNPSQIREGVQKLAVALQPIAK
jgi:GntR family transcriptional regulator / MocR family aminotransferase